MRGFQKVKFKLVADGVNFEDVVDFRTEHFVGIFDEEGRNFIVLPRYGAIRGVIVIEATDTLEELDQKVYDMLNEHIEDVADWAGYMLQEIPK